MDQLSFDNAQGEADCSSVCTSLSVSYRKMNLSKSAHSFSYMAFIICSILSSLPLSCALRQFGQRGEA